MVNFKCKIGTDIYIVSSGAYGNCYCVMFSQTKMVVAHTTVSKNSLCHSSTYSRLSPNRHLYKTSTSVKRTLRVGPCLSLLPLFDSL